MSKYTVLRTKNDWLSNYKGQTFNAKLNEELIKGIFSEHSKHKSGNENFTEQLGKKCLVTCINPETMELESIGASSLLKDELTGKIIDNLILDNFGIWFKAIMGHTATVSMTDDTGSARVVQVYTTGNTMFNQIEPNTPSTGSAIQMGSGTTTPARDDIAIFTALGSPPEDDYIVTDSSAYTAGFTITYKADANPTGGSGTVNEAGTFGKWFGDPVTEYTFMLTHDLVSPSVTFSAGKLLRAAYVWVI